jgi:hypothetical protein
MNEFDVSIGISACTQKLFLLLIQALILVVHVNLACSEVVFDTSLYFNCVFYRKQRRFRRLSGPMRGPL